MIATLYYLSCDFNCTNSVTDEFDSPEDAREIMSKHGWRYVKVENGSYWDQCPKCHGKEND